MYINSRSLESLSQNVPQMLELFGTVIAQLGGGFNFKDIYIYIHIPRKTNMEMENHHFCGRYRDTSLFMAGFPLSC